MFSIDRNDLYEVAIPMRTLIIFAKTAVEGKVKTRLTTSTPLNDEQTTLLYEAFLKDTFTMATLSSAERIAIHYHPGDDAAMKKMRRLVRSLSFGARNERRFHYVPQAEGDFTTKVVHAFTVEKELAGGHDMVIIGADSPLVRPETLDDAFNFIYQRSGMTLGPSGGGGVYLIGYAENVELDYSGVFTEGSELENLLNRAKHLKIPFKLLPETIDVDIEEDLVTLVGMVHALAYERNFGDGYYPVFTHKAIEELRLGVVRTADDTRAKRIVIKPEE